MPGEVERICALLDGGSAELQCAAALVLGELKPKEPAARKALIQALHSPNEQVAVYCVDALSRIDGPAALPHLVPLLAGPEPVRARVSRVLAELGSAAADGLREHLDSKDARVRKGVLEILGGLKEVDTTDAVFAGLLDPDLEVVRKAAQAYRDRVGGMGEAERGAALKRILAFMDSPRVRKAKTPLASCLDIVAALKDPAAAKSVLPYVDRKQPPAVRTHALLALAALPLEGKGAAAAAAKLLPLLEEEDLAGVVGPALDVLWKIPPSKDALDRILRLRKSPHLRVRKFAVRALGAIGTPAAAGPLVEALGSEDPSTADTAANALRSNPDFAPVLARALDRQEGVDAQFRIVNILRTYRNVLDKATVRGFVAKGLALLSKKRTGFQAYFEAARASAPELLRETLLRKGRELLGKGKAEEAERVLLNLQRDDVATAETDLALAIAQLRLQRLDLSGAGRDRGHAVSIFSRLSRREGFPFAKALEKDAGLVTPAGLLYLGFALVERPGEEREAGVQVLRLVARKYGSKEAGKVARQKLKTQGAG
jgi:HEAT repeat protein